VVKKRISPIVETLSDGEYGAHAYVYPRACA